MDLFEQISNAKDEDSNVIEYYDEDGSFAVKVAQKRNIANPEDIATEYLDRTVYYLIPVEQLDGSVKTEERIFALRGSYISKPMMKEALKLEEEFKELNNEKREELGDDIMWRARAGQQNKLYIYKKKL